MNIAICTAAAVVGICGWHSGPRYEYMPLVAPAYSTVIQYHSPVIYNPPVFAAPAPVRYYRPAIRQRYYAAPPVSLRGRCYTLPSGRRICN